MNGTDIRILHPRTTFTAGRPSWLLREGLWKAVRLQNLSYQVSFPCLVRAYFSNEENGVPVDLIELRHAGEKSLVLPPSLFRLELTDHTGKVQTETIEVE